MACTAKDPHPPQHFLYLTETNIWWCEEGGEGEKVSMLTHTTAKGMGKKKHFKVLSKQSSPYPLSLLDCPPRFIKIPPRTPLKWPLNIWQCSPPSIY